MSETVACVAKNGVVDHIDEQKIYVRILSLSACASCNAKGFCSSAESSEKLIEVDRQNSPEVNTGQSVQIIMNASNGNMAVVYGYVIPFIILIIALVILSAFLPEAYAGLGAIVLLIPYYAGLYLFKDRLKKRFNFTIEINERVNKF